MERQCWMCTIPTSIKKNYLGKGSIATQIFMCISVLLLEVLLKQRKRIKVIRIFHKSDPTLQQPTSLKHLKDAPKKFEGSAWNMTTID